jgi:hypothetical protein
VASARQIAANRRDARKSTGPRSAAGKKRASRNAYRHGLAAGVGHCGTYAVQIETLALAIIGAATGWRAAATDAEILEFGRLAAKAELDIAYIRGLKATRMNALLTAIHAQIAAIAQAAENSCVAISETSKQSRECLPETAALYATRCRHRGPSIAMSDAIACRDRAVLQVIAGTKRGEHTLLLRLGPIE